MKGNYYSIQIILLLFFNPLNAQVFPEDFSQVPVASNIVNPTVFTFTPDGRILVCEQAGKIHVVKNDELLPTPFHQFTVHSTGERGLIGIALDPDFHINQYVYVYYTVPGTPAHNRISRLTADGDVAASGSEVIILELDNLSGATNHNGGAMHFGLDEKLYVAVGDNASGANAQNLNTYHGKLLRINKDGSAPDDNPFPDGSEQRQRVWSYGLRNPYTFSIEPVTGKIWVNDVGQNAWEEINDATEPGSNFGWPQEEGMGTNPAYVNPVYAYQHGGGDGRGCAITGGTFFSPAHTNYPPEYFGKYFFQDYCNNWINILDVSTGEAVRSSFATGLPANGLSILTGNDGNLYYLSRNTGILYKVIYDKETPPFITSQSENMIVFQGEEAVFFVNAIGTAPLEYQWFKDGEEIPEGTSSTYLIENARAEDTGIYKVEIQNVVGTVESNEVLLTVVDDNGDPVLSVEDVLSRSVSLFPNPVRGSNQFVSLTIHSQKEQQAKIYIIDLLSREIGSDVRWLQPGENLMKIQVDTLGDGLYGVGVKIGREHVIKRLMISR